MPRFPAPDARGWIGISVFALTVMILWMMAAFPDLRQDEFFKTIATLVIGTAFVNGVVGWAYSATKQGGELAERAATMAEQHATSTNGNPQKVEIQQPPDKPVPTSDVPSTSGAELPDYARAS